MVSRRITARGFLQACKRQAYHSGLGRCIRWMSPKTVETALQREGMRGIQSPPSAVLLTRAHVQ